MRRHEDWLRQAKKDLKAAKDSLHMGNYEWACFQAQQSAEKAAKALCDFRRIDAWGHVVSKLLEELSSSVKIPKRIADKSKILDRYYIPTRYPNGFESGAPMDYYLKEDAEEAIKYAEEIINFCKRNIQK